MSNSIVMADFEYADDMILICDSMVVLETRLQAVERSCAGVGLMISANKTKILGVCPSDRSSQPQGKWY